MKTVLVLSVLLCAALAAPAEVEEKSPDVPAELKQQPAAALEEEPAAAAAEEMLSEAKNEVPADSENEKVPAEDEDKDEGSEPALRNGGWFTHGFRCYIFVTSPKNWFSAKDYCNSLGANLASVSSAREYSFLQQLTKKAGQTIGWLGGFHLQGRWMWINNEGFNYTNWYSQSTASAYPCMYLSSTYGWRNTQCTQSLRFICSKTPFGC